MVYARYGVSYARLVDPTARTLEAFMLRDVGRAEIGRFTGADRVAVPPCEAITLRLDELCS
jgi:hypothetical protein